MRGSCNLARRMQIALGLAVIGGAAKDLYRRIGVRLRCSQNSRGDVVLELTSYRHSGAQRNKTLHCSLVLVIFYFRPGYSSFIYCARKLQHIAVFHH
jgi:hypothetical protein